MGFNFIALLFVSWLSFGAGWAVADSSQPASAVRQIEEPDFSPPPVPEFMLRRPEKPLTLEEMQKQADEAAHRSRQKKNEPIQPPSAKTSE